MGKERFYMCKKSKWIGAVFVAAALSFSLVGCGSSKETENTVDTVDVQEEVTTTEIFSEETAKEEKMEAPEQVGDMYQGKITAIDDNSVTVVLAETMHMKEKPEGEKKPVEGEKPEGDKKPAEGEKPEGDKKPVEGEKPEEMTKPAEGEKPQGGARELTFTDETKTFEITDATVIKLNGETATISDLAVDDVVMVKMDGETVLEISIVNMEGFQDAEAPQMPFTEEVE